MNARRWLVTILAAGTVVSGSMVASAQDSEAPLPPVAEVQGGRFGRFGERGPQGAIRDAIRDRMGSRERGFGLGALIQAASDATGLDVTEIAQLLRSDTTLAEIIQSAGGDVNSVIGTVLADAQSRAAEAVENGRITQETADELLARLEAHLNEVVTQSPLSRRVEFAAPAAVLRFAAEQLAVDPRDLRESLAAGQSLASLLTEGGIDVNRFVEDVMARAAARLNVLVVDGASTQERADQQLADLQAQLLERINQAGQTGV